MCVCMYVYIYIYPVKRLPVQSSLQVTPTPELCLSNLAPSFAYALAPCLFGRISQPPATDGNCDLSTWSTTCLSMGVEVLEIPLKWPWISWIFEARAFGMTETWNTENHWDDECYRKRFDQACQRYMVTWHHLKKTNGRAAKVQYEDRDVGPIF